MNSRRVVTGSAFVDHMPAEQIQDDKQLYARLGELAKELVSSGRIESVDYCKAVLKNVREISIRAKQTLQIHTTRDQIYAITRDLIAMRFSVARFEMAKKNIFERPWQFRRKILTIDLFTEEIVSETPHGDIAEIVRRAEQQAFEKGQNVGYEQARKKYKEEPLTETERLTLTRDYWNKLVLKDDAIEELQVKNHELQTAIKRLSSYIKRTNERLQEFGDTNTRDADKIISGSAPEFKAFMHDTVTIDDAPLE